MEDEDGGIECWVKEGVKDALVRRYSIQVRCSHMEEVCCWRYMQQTQLLTCLSTCSKLGKVFEFGDEEDCGKLLCARCMARSALSS